MYLWLLQFSLQFILHSETRHCMAHMHLQNCKIRIVFFCYVMLFKNHEYAISIENNPYYSLLVICVVVLLNLFFMFSFTFSANTITTSSVGYFFSTGFPCRGEVETEASLNTTEVSRKPVQLSKASGGISVTDTVLGLLFGLCGATIVTCAAYYYWKKRRHRQRILLIFRYVRIFVRYFKIFLWYQYELEELKIENNFFLCF